MSKTVKTIVEAIRERGGDYFLFVTANQPELKAELPRAFGDVSPSRHRHRRANQGRQAT